MKNNPALNALRHHVTGAIERGEAVAIAAVTRDNASIADGLDNVAAGQVWDGEALYLAEQHPAATFTDRIVIRRYQHGIARGTDHVTLQRIAANIREA